MERMEEFIRAWERLAAEVEQVVAQYPPDMRDELRSHALDVLRGRLQNLWDEQQQRRARLS